MSLGVVAIVGSPNVGKSTIFNRMVGERHAIVDDERGITRDRLYASCEWLGHKFSLIDTGGIQIENVPFQKEINAQVEIAIDEADVIIFLVNGKEGLTSNDEYIAKLLKKSKKPVILAVNKIDDISKIDNIYEFYKLGVGDPIAVSGVHGIGIGDVLDKVTELMPEREIEQYDGMIKFAIIGRPNVGKSSLTNAFLKQDRVIVSDIEGTTRDVLEEQIYLHGVTLNIMDTAGIRQ